MSDTAAARLSGESPEQVAYKLMLLVGSVENKITGTGMPNGNATRKWLLDTYAECLHATRGFRDYDVSE